MTLRARLRRAVRPRVAAAAAVLVLVVVGGYVALVARRGDAVVSLPPPSGPYAVGRLEDQVTDDARGGRKLAVWTWYPARPGTGPTATYAPAAWEGLQIGVPIGRTPMDRVRDRAGERAAPAAGRFPVVVLAPGLGFAAPQYAALAEDLASRGHVVVGVTPTGSANLTVLDGHAVGATADGNPSALHGDQSEHDRAIAQRLLTVWVADLRLAATSTGRTPGSALLTEHVDATTVAYVGHSFGGSAALQACHDDVRCRAAVDLDGALYGAVSAEGLRVPVALVQHDGSCIGGVCTPRDDADRADVAVAQRFRAASTGPVTAATVRGSGHLNFTDDGLLYWAFPLHRLLGLGPADGRAVLAQTAVLVAAALDGPVPERASGGSA